MCGFHLMSLMSVYLCIGSRVRIIDSVRWYGDSGRQGLKIHGVDLVVDSAIPHIALILPDIHPSPSQSQLAQVKRDSDESNAATIGEISECESL